MKAVSITCVGKLKEDYFVRAAAEYAKRLGRFCKLNVTELPDVSGPDEVRRESEAIKRTLAPGEYVILTDVCGDLVTSEELARIIDSAYLGGKSAVRFVIGGSRGVDASIKAAADKRISFGRVTYPRQLMRVILLEQIYRAFTITEGLPYHK